MNEYCRHIKRRCNAYRYGKCKKRHYKVHEVDEWCKWQISTGQCKNHNECIYRYHQRKRVATMGGFVVNKTTLLKLHIDQSNYITIQIQSDTKASDAIQKIITSRNLPSTAQCKLYQDNQQIDDNANLYEIMQITSGSQIQVRFTANNDELKQNKYHHGPDYILKSDDEEHDFLNISPYTITSPKKNINRNQLRHVFPNKMNLVAFNSFSAQKSDDSDDVKEEETLSAAEHRDIMSDMDQLLTEPISELNFNDLNFNSFKQYLLGDSQKISETEHESNIMYYLGNGQQNDPHSSGGSNNDNAKKPANNAGGQDQFNGNTNTNGGASDCGGDGNGRRDRNNDEKKKDNDSENKNDDEDEDEQEEEEEEEEKKEQESESDTTKFIPNPHATTFVPRKWCSVPCSTLPTIVEHIATTSVRNVSFCNNMSSVQVNNITSSNCNNCQTLQTSMDQKDLYILHLLNELTQKGNEIYQLKLLLYQQSCSNIIINNDPNKSSTPTNQSFDNMIINKSQNVPVPAKCQTIHKQNNDGKPISNSYDFGKKKHNKRPQRILTNQFSKTYSDYAVYAPANETRAQGNIQISKDFTSTISTTIEENISDIYSYIDKNTSVQSSYEYNDGNIRIFNHDFHSKRGHHILYCVAERQDKTVKANRGYGWRMKTKLFTSNEIANTYGVSTDKLPKSLRSSKQFHGNVNKNHIRQIYDQIKKINFVSDIKWNKIPIYSQRAKIRGCRVKLSLTLPQFRKRLHFKENKKIIPIIIFRNDEPVIQYICVATIVGFNTKVFLLLKASNSIARYCPNSTIENILSYINEPTDIGIAFECNRIEPIGIHLHKQNLINNHQLLYPQKSMNDLDDFESIYEDLQIGDVDYEENIIKIQRRKMEQQEALIDQMTITDSSSSPSYRAHQLTSTSTTSSD